MSSKKNKNPLISICIFSYNNSNRLPEVIKSAYSSCSKDFEIVVVDDGSTDDTDAVVKRLYLPNLRYFYIEHSGRPTARNKCIAEARGEYIAWIGADDEYIPGIMDIYTNMTARYPEVDIFYGNLLMADKKMIHIKELSYKEWYGHSQELPAAMVFRNSIPDGGSLIKKSAYDRFGLYDVCYPRAQDYEWFARVSSQAEFKHLGCNTSYWRILDSQFNYPGPKASFGANVVKKLLERFPLDQLVPHVGWGKLPDNEAESLARLLLAHRFIYLKSKADALEQIKRVIALRPCNDILCEAKNIIHRI